MVEKFENSNDITREYFNHLLLEQRLMDAVEPDTSVRIFGHKFDTPIMTSALSHMNEFHKDADHPMENYAKGAAMMNTMHWVGMIENPDLDSILQQNAKTVRIIKPYADTDKIFSQIAYAEEKGAFAVGMDIDHWFDNKGNIDIVIGETMKNYSSSEIRAFIESTKLPFIIKGVLSVHDALKSAAIGAKGIVISHHGGRLKSAVPPLLVLPEIRKALGDEFPIFVDCCFESGLDAYKALALGATAVSVGKHLIPIVVKDSAEGVFKRLSEMTAELKGAMAYTGVSNTNSFDTSVIHKKW